MPIVMAGMFKVQAHGQANQVKSGAAEVIRGEQQRSVVSNTFLFTDIFVACCVVYLRHFVAYSVAAMRYGGFRSPGSDSLAIANGGSGNYTSNMAIISSFMLTHVNNSPPLHPDFYSDASIH